MSHKTVYEAINAVVPCAHMTFPAGEAPALPWAVYYLNEGRGMYGDNKRYSNVNSWTVELYEKSRDEELERAVAQAIEDEPSFSSYDTYESWVESEQCLMVVFSFSEVEKNS